MILAVLLARPGVSANSTYVLDSQCFSECCAKGQCLLCRSPFRRAATGVPAQWLMLHVRSRLLVVSDFHRSVFICNIQLIWFTNFYPLRDAISRSHSCSHLQFLLEASAGTSLRKAASRCRRRGSCLRLVSILRTRSRGAYPSHSLLGDEVARHCHTRCLSP